MEKDDTILVKFCNWASEASPTLGCSIEISRDIYMSVCMSVVCPITWNHVNQTRACSKSVLGGKIRPVTPVLFVSRAGLVWTEEKRSLRNEKLKANRAS